MAKLKNWPEGYQEKFEQILGTEISADGTVAILFPYESIQEARSTIRQISRIKRQMRELRQEAGREITQIRKEYQARQGKVTGGAWTRLAGKKAAEIDRQRQHDQLEAQQQKSLQPYETVQNTIDRLLAEIDQVKLQVKDYISEAEKSSEA